MTSSQHQSAIDQQQLLASLVQILNSQSLGASLPSSVAPASHASTLVDQSHVHAAPVRAHQQHPDAVMRTDNQRAVLARDRVQTRPHPAQPAQPQQPPAPPAPHRDVTERSLQLSPTAIARFLAEVGLNVSLQQRDVTESPTAVRAKSHVNDAAQQVRVTRPAAEVIAGNNSFNSATTEKSVHFASPVQVKNFSPRSPLAHPQPQSGSASPPLTSASSWPSSRFRSQRKEVASLNWQWHLRRLPALVRGYLVRRLYRTEKVKTIINSISVSEAGSTSSC